MGPTTTDWYAWHAPYDDLLSPLTARLALVQEYIGRFLDAAPPGPLRVISIAAGQSRDLLPMLIAHPRGPDVTALMVDLDARNVDFAQGAAESAGLDRVTFAVGDAGLVDTFACATPADLLLLCGVLDQLDDDAVARTVTALPQLCAPHAHIIWADSPLTARSVRYRERAFAAAGFATQAAVETADYTVGAVTLAIEPIEPVPGTRMFRLR